MHPLTLLCTTFLSVATFASAQDPIAKNPIVKVTKNPDILIFKDGGNLHGKFQGISDQGKVRWVRDGEKKEQLYQLKEISQISYNGGRPQANSPKLGLLKLTNGDQIPGTITKLTDTHLSLSSTTGEITVKREFIAAYEPVTLGSGISFNGFNKQQTWKQLPYTYYPRSSARKEAWQFHGASWYARTNKCGAIHNPEIKLPDNFAISFKLAFKGYSNLDIALLCDLKKPLSKKEIDKLPAEQKKKLKEPNVSSPAHTFGSFINLRLQNSYAYLQAYKVNEDNLPVAKNFNNGQFHRRPNNAHLEEQHIIVRGSRKNSSLELLINGKITNQWVIPEEFYPKSGKQLAFYCQNANQGTIRLSELIIAEWSGAKDPISSLFHPSKDIVLLTNGTDRFAGKVTGIASNKANITTDFSKISLSLDKVKTINFSEPKKKAKERGEDDIVVRFYHNGIVTGKPAKQKNKQSITLLTPYNQTITIPLNAIQGIESSELSDLIHSWSEQF